MASKVEELTQKMCQYGVEYKTLGEVCTIIKGTQLNRDSLLEEGEYPVINGGISPSGYWGDYNFDANRITISQGGASAGYVNFIMTPFWAGAHCYVVKSCASCVIYRFLYHFIKSQQTDMMSKQVGAGIPSVSLSFINNLVIPVPPLEIQKEIVKVPYKVLYLCNIWVGVLHCKPKCSLSWL